MRRKIGFFGYITESEEKKAKKGKRGDKEETPLQTTEEEEEIQGACGAVANEKAGKSLL